MHMQTKSKSDFAPGGRILQFVGRYLILFGLLAALACSQDDASAADFRTLDQAFTATVRLTAGEPAYHAEKLRQLATERGQTSDRSLFEGLNTRQSIAMALDQIAASSFEKQLKAGRPPRPDDLQVLTNALETLKSLEAAEAANGQRNDLIGLRTKVYATFVSPLTARPGRKELKPLAEAKRGILIAQFVGAAEGGVRVLDLYAEPSELSLAWSLKTFFTPFPDARIINGRAYFAEYLPRKEGSLAIYVDLGPLTERERKEIFSQFAGLQQAGLVVILDNSVGRLKACVTAETDRMERQLGERLAKAQTTSEKDTKVAPEKTTAAPPSGLSEKEESGIRRQCEVKERMPALDNRIVVFDPRRAIAIANYQLASGGTAAWKPILAEARYALERWP